MNNLKKILLFISSILFLNSCGFTPLYNFKSTNFYISEISTNNENSLFYTFKNFINPYMDKKNKEINHALIVDLEKLRIVTSKDSNGNPLVYSMIVKAKIFIKSNDKIMDSINYEKKFKYSHKSSIFDLNLYEKEIEKNLIKNIVDEMIVVLINSYNTVTTSKNYKININTTSEIGYGTSS